jgi:O-antigen ligase
MCVFSGRLRQSTAPVGWSPWQNVGGGSGSVTAWNGPLVTLLALALALGAGLLIVRLPLLDGVLFVVLAVAGGATVVEPLVGVVAALSLGLLRAYLGAVVPQVPAQIGHVFVALALAAWMARGLAVRRLWIRRLPLLLPLLIFVAAALVSLWDAVEVQIYGVLELTKWVQILLLFPLVADRLAAGDEAFWLPPAGVETRPTSQRLRWLLGALLVIGLFQAGVGMWQFVLRGEGPEHFAIVEDRLYRAYGTFEQPNPYAGYIGLVLSLGIGMLIGVMGDQKTGRKGDKGDVCSSSSPCPLVSSSPRLPLTLVSRCLALAFIIAALGASLVMSWSRGAWMGFGAAAIVMAIALPRKGHWGVLLVVVLLVGGLGLYSTGLLPPSVADRLTSFTQYVQFEDVRGVGISDANYAVYERLAHWQAALDMFRDDLWTGVGFGDYEPAYPKYALINWPLALGHAHNYYLNVAAETGLIGLAAYLLLWGAIFWQTWRATRRAQGLLRGVAIGILGAWTHLSVHHLLDNLYVNNVHLLVGVLLGTLVFIVQETGEEASERISESANGRICK